MFINLNLPNMPEHEAYPLDFSQLAPNHNPLISEEAFGTFDNCQSVQCLLLKLLLQSDRLELDYSERETRGLLCILECVTDAMHFELYHRCVVEKED